VKKYGLGESTYRDVAWGDADGEKDDAVASVCRVFRAVNEIAEKSSELLLEAQQQVVESGLKLDDEPKISNCMSSAEMRSKTYKKQLRLNMLRRLLTMLSQYFGDRRGEVCDAYRSLCLGFRLPTPHWMQQALF